MEENKKCHLCQTSNQKTKLCSRCKLVRYCSIECQKSDWPKHKLECIFGAGAGMIVLRTNEEEKEERAIQNNDENIKPPQIEVVEPPKQEIQPPPEIPSNPPPPEIPTPLEKKAQPKLPSLPEMPPKATKPLKSPKKPKTEKPLTPKNVPHTPKASSKGYGMYLTVMIILIALATSFFTMRSPKKPERMGTRQVIESVKIKLDLGWVKEEKRAEELCLESAKLGNPLAEGMKHYYGWEVPMNTIKAYHIFKKITKEDAKGKHEETSYAYFYLAQMYTEGDGLKKDVNKGLECYYKSAELNNTYSIANLALIFEGGENGVEKDFNKAMQYFEKGVQLNNSQSMYRLSKIYEEGELVKKDIPKAMDYLKRAAELRNMFAINDLAGNYFIGDKLPRDVKKAMELFTIAAEQFNVPNSMNILGNIYLTGEEGFVKKDTKKAARYFSKAIELDEKDASSMVNLAGLYNHGDGVIEDPKRALELYQNAASLSSALGYYNLGMFFENGRAVKKDVKKAMDYYRRLQVWETKMRNNV